MESPERRRGYDDLQQAVASLQEGQDRLIHLLEGNGQPGFIDITRAQIQEIKLWQAKKEAVDQNNDKVRIKSVAVWGLVITGLNIGLNLAINFIKSFWGNPHL